MSGPGASYEVLLTEGAEQDLESIYDYIAEFNCTANAEHMLDQLMDVVGSLSQFPDRGVTQKSWSIWAFGSIGRHSFSDTV